MKERSLPKTGERRENLENMACIRTDDDLAYNTFFYILLYK
jgi:hypothetical protein